jgi:ATP-binding cassette, subfamily B, bacterial PglK
MRTNSNPEDTESHHDLNELLVTFWHHLSKNRQRQLALLLLLMLASAFCEVISLGAVLPFIGVLIAPDKVFNHATFRVLFETVGITSPEQLVTPITIAFALAALAAGSIRLLLLWINSRLSNAIGADISTDVYRRTLYQPYRIHVARNSSELIAAITGKTWKATVVLYEAITIVSSTFLLIALIATLVAINPFVVFVSTIVFGVSYGLITWASRRQLRINSRRTAIESIQVVKALQEGLGAIRDVLLNGTQQFYCDNYRQADVPYREANASNLFIIFAPRFAMEAIGLVLISGLAYVLSRKAGGITSALPVLGALALGAQRFLPAIQQIYGSWSGILANQVSLGEVIKLLDQPLPADALEPVPEPLEFKASICFKSVWFRYVEDSQWVLQDVNVSIPKGFRMGFVGSTGSGKSTTLDLLMGLLEPTKGRILVDGLPITGKRLRSWQQAIAHVPQSIFLADSTLAENIALGIARNSIDMERLRQAAKQAHIDDFIENQPKKYYTSIGERGVRLSGGQKQRIGIARALYKEASVLVFDEATSALDNETEHLVMSSIESLNKELTILIIAHRLTTIQHCDQIVELADGRVVAQGSYEELMEQSPSFRRMAVVKAVVRQTDV